MKMYEKKNFPRTIHDFNKMHKDGKLSFDNAVQRGLTWDNDRKSLLIHSMIIDFPVPPMYCNCAFSDPKEKVYDFIDGKQRVLGALIPFYNDEITLSNVPIINTDENSESDEDADPEKLIDINGLKYSGLPQEFQDKVRMFSFTVFYYENMAQDDIEEMFYRLNNGRALSSIELSRAKAKSLECITQIGKHEIFGVALSEKAINKYTNEDIVIKSWAMLNVENPSFETKDIRPLIQTAEITQEHKEILEKAYDRILDAYHSIKSDESKESVRIAKRILTRTHLIALVPLAVKSLEDKVELDAFVKWAVNFFNGKKTTISEEYNSTIGSGSAKADKVRTRNDAIVSNYKEHFKALWMGKLQNF